MGRSVQPTLGPMEVNRVDRPDSERRDVVNKVDCLEIPLEMAKAKFGAAVGRAIGDDALKAYGDKGLLSNVIAGKVPDYLGRIYQKRGARRRLAKALLEDDSGVIVTTKIEFRDDEEKAG